MDIAEQLRALRKARGMTQEELAQALYVTRQSVYKWESGKALPDLEKVKQLCLLYGIFSDELLGIPPQTIPPQTVEEVPPTTDAASPTTAVVPETPCEIVPEEPPSPMDDAPPEEPSQTMPTERPKPARRWLWLVVGCLALVAAVLLWLGGYAVPREVRLARADGMIPPQMSSMAASEVSERDFLRLLCNAARLRLEQDSPALTAALQEATGERLTREKAAYWLYCGHIWTTIDPSAVLVYDGEVTTVSLRNQWEDMNHLGREAVDALEPPWERHLCKELDEVGALFAVYDGTVAMDTEINAILDGRCYASVAFCLGQRSFATGEPIMETTDGRFRPKERLTATEAVVAVRRLYESW